MGEESLGNYELFMECVSAAVIEKLTDKPTRRPRKRLDRGGKKSLGYLETAQREGSPGASDVDDPAELGEFIHYLATEIFEPLPAEFKSLSYRLMQGDQTLADIYGDPISASTLADLTGAVPADVISTLTTYLLLDLSATDIQSFLSPIFSSYISSVKTPPPSWISTRTSACEICERDWIPLTYHHLIPKSVHSKVLKRGWHEEAMLNSVAWLCRACHSFVHRMAPNEELAKQWYTIDKICEREDVRKWAQWAGGVRWKKR